MGEDFLRLLAARGLAPRDAFRRYEALHARSLATAYAYCAEVMAGREEAWLQEEARAFFAQRFAGRVFRYVRPLLARLAARGLEPWVVSASPRWLVQAGAVALGIPAGRVLAVSVPVEGGRLGAVATQPVPCGPGKVRALEAAGVRPFLALGNGEIDAEMLASARHALAVAPRDIDTPLVRVARARGWPVLRV